MSERFLPDKAIDALDEAGSRVHITNIEVPKNFDLERQLEEIRELKPLLLKKKNMKRLLNLEMTRNASKKN
jgi:ATP-dependent Clp protease ATP-binding subunit ClpC